jgi:hypothetical protein
MSRQYPIWNQVDACIYQSSKSWGAKQASCVQVKVGTSSRNSFDFVQHSTTCRTLDNGDKEFRFYVDGKCIKRCLVTKKDKKFKKLGTRIINKTKREAVA